MDNLLSNFSKNLHIHALEILWNQLYELHCGVFNMLLLVMHIPRFLTLNLSSFEKQ